MENFGYFAGSKKTNTLWLVFRGTDNIRNWFTNFNIVKSKFDANREEPSYVDEHFPNLAAGNPAETQQEKVIDEK